jgi:hypothetical protein
VLWLILNVLVTENIQGASGVMGNILRGDVEHCERKSS